MCASERPPLKRHFADDPDHRVKVVALRLQNTPELFVLHGVHRLLADKPLNVFFDLWVGDRSKRLLRPAHEIALGIWKNRRPGVEHVRQKCITAKPMVGQRLIELNVDAVGFDLFG